MMHVPEVTYWYCVLNSHRRALLYLEVIDIFDDTKGTIATRHMNEHDMISIILSLILARPTNIRISRQFRKSQFGIRKTEKRTKISNSFPPSVSQTCLHL